MSTKEFSSYEEAVQVYLSGFRALRATPLATGEIATRGAGVIPVETFIQRAEEIADVSASMAPLAENYLEASEPALREGISGQLLAQAAAELQLATELLQIAAEQTGEAQAPVTRAVREANLQDAIDHLEKTLQRPVSSGLLPPGMALRAAVAANTLEQARKALEKAASVTLGGISQRVVETGGDLAFNLVFNTEWSAVIQSAGLLSRDVANLLDRVKAGAGELTQSAIAAAAKTILNVFDKILALLGKDAENQVRMQIQNWLEDIRKSGKIELFDQLVNKLYQINQFEKDLPGWLEKSTAPLDKLNATTTDISALSEKFIVLVGQINAVGDVIGLARFIQIQFPQVLVIVTGIRVALLAILVYAGYDFIGYKQVDFINITKGVGEIIRENLVDPAPTAPPTPAQ